MKQGTPKPKATANPALRPEDLTVLDPACGSGHILVYAFDLLFAIYGEQGYPEPQIPALILEHNLYGLDIDERAAQLTSFALMMKAREKSRRILRNPPELHVTQTVPTRGWVLPDVPELNGADWQPLLDAFRDADNLGSLISPPPVDLNALTAQLGAFEASGRQEVSVDAPRLRQLLKQAGLLSKQYLAVVANPPYMGTSRFNLIIKRFVVAKYPRSKSDMFAVFMERLAEFTANKGCAGMVTMHSWMFLSSYEELRKVILDNYDLQTMAHLGPKAFPEIGGEVVQTTAFTIAKQPPQSSPSTFVRLVEYDTSKKKEKALLSGAERFTRDKQQDFEKIPGSPIAYWVSEIALETFTTAELLHTLATPRAGMITSGNDIFVRQWFELEFGKIGLEHRSRIEAKASKNKWFPYQKGGSFRRWYGNREHVVNWQNDGEAIRTRRDTNGKIPAHAFNEEYIFRANINWSAVTAGMF